MLTISLLVHRKYYQLCLAADGLTDRLPTLDRENTDTRPRDYGHFTDTRQATYRPPVGRHIDRVSIDSWCVGQQTIDRYIGGHVDISTDMSVDISVDTSIYQPIGRSIVGRYIDRYIGGHYL